MTIHFFCISQSIQEWSDWVEKKLNDLINSHFQVAMIKATNTWS